MSAMLVLADAFDAIRTALRPDGGTLVLAAPPGSGKTTLVPLALLDEPWLTGQRIVLLEPRRIAARAAAHRMASLLGEAVGDTVGFVTRDERRVSAATRIEVITEGVLTQRLLRDPELPGVALVIFDEIHERNLNTDISLAFALEARSTVRPDLRIAAMSATVEAERVAFLIGNGTPAPQIEAGGQPHPVDIRWFPKKPSDRLESAITQVIVTALRREAGDVLVFLPGAGEIRKVHELLEPTVGNEVDIRPLFGMLSSADQDLALRPDPAGRRRVVLSTDIAESSVTVDGVRIVVDGGLHKAPRFDTRTGLTRLQTEPISKSSADQRAGRAGRQGPGTVYRLWAKGEHTTRKAFAAPEITQVDLAGFVLAAAAWGTPVTELPLLDAPPAAALEDATVLLTALGAIDEHGAITSLGRSMNALPLHPRLARMIEAARDGGDDGDLALAAALAALLEERDVMRGRPEDIPTDLDVRLGLLADSSRRHPNGDGRALATVRRRTTELAQRIGLPNATDELANALWHRAGRLLAVGFPDRIGVRRSQAGRFQLPSGTVAWVRPTDPLAQEQYVVAVDMEGDRREARIRMAAAIDATDVAAVFGDDVAERTEIRWDPKRDELVEIVERRHGLMVLDDITRRPEPSDQVVAMLLQRVRERGLDQGLHWPDSGVQIRARGEFLWRSIGAPWADWSTATLTDTLDVWLAPWLTFARSRADMEALDPADILLSNLDYATRSQLDRLAPPTWQMRSGRHATIDYRSDTPILAVRAQDLFGTTMHPMVVDGRVPLLIHVLSPAGRPVQVTSDLPGFWAGSWADVRKEMAGRYPKHAWPVDPASAPPPSR